MNVYQTVNISAHSNHTLAMIPENKGIDWNHSDTKNIVNRENVQQTIYLHGKDAKNTFYVKEIIYSYFNFTQKVRIYFEILVTPLLEKYFSGLLSCLISSDSIAPHRNICVKLLNVNVQFKQ